MTRFSLSQRWLVCALGLVLSSVCWGEGAPCLILKHKGTVGRRLIFTALTGIPIAPGAKFDFVDSLNIPEVGLTYTTKQVNAMLHGGLRVIILPTNYKLEDLQDARQECRAMAPVAAEDTAASHYAAGEVLMKQQKYADALLEYRMALDIEPLNPGIQQREKAAEAAAVSAER